MANKVIGGATAQDWLNSGASQLIADPATFPGGDSGVPYIANDANATDAATINMFNALDRDALIEGDTLFGIGVHNPYNDGFVTTGQFTGISSTPSEIGYYPDAVEGDQADKLTIKLDGSLTNAKANVSFFYQGEQSGEQLKYELYLNGVKVGEETVSSGNGLSYSSTQPGLFTVDLDGFTGDVQVFDEVRFSGATQTTFLDASDFLLESITGDTAEGLSPGYWKNHLSAWNESSECNDVTTTDLFDAYFGINPDGVKASVLAGGLTLQEVLNLTGGGEQALARQAVAALINMNSGDIDTYPMTQDDLVDAVNAALVGNDAAATQALTNLLQTYNTLETDWT